VRLVLVRPPSQRSDQDAAVVVGGQIVEHRPARPGYLRQQPEVTVPEMREVAAGQHQTASGVQQHPAARPLGQDTFDRPPAEMIDTPMTDVTEIQAAVLVPQRRLRHAEARCEHLHIRELTANHVTLYSRYSMASPGVNRPIPRKAA
jgi:hypothetical protein